MSQALSVATRAPAAHAAAPVRHHAGRPSPTTKAGPQRARTPLSVVPAQPTRRRVPFAVFSLLVLGAALAAVLMLNISVSGTQYELVQLRNQQVALNQENEALVLEIEGREAPQNLAAAATKLDMVSSPTFGTLELDSRKVTGEPEPATEGPKPEVLIAAPNLATGQPAPVDPPDAPSGVDADVEREAATTAPSVEGGDATDGDRTDSAAGTIPGPVQSGIGG